MVTLKKDTFPQDDEGKALINKIVKSLTHICGHGVAADGTLLTVPKRLNADRDMLRENYRQIWKDAKIQYGGEEQRVADSNHRTYEIRIGEFFLKPEHKVMDIEKVILHEYLHLVIDMEWRAAHHGQINQIIQYNLGYPGDPNPFCTD